MSVWTGKTGTIRLDGEDIGALRHAVYLRAKGKCEECGVRVHEESGRWRSMHLSHVIARGAGGGDTEENTKAHCADCHLVQIHNPRSVRCKD